MRTGKGGCLDFWRGFGGWEFAERKESVLVLLGGREDSS